MSTDYEYAEIHSKVISLVSSARAFAKRAGAKGAEIEQYIDQVIQNELGCSSIEVAHNIRKAVDHERGRRMREAKGQKGVPLVKSNGKFNHHRGDPIARLDEMKAELIQYETEMKAKIARLEAELSKPKAPQQFSCKWFSVQKGDEDGVWVIRTLGRYGRTYLGRMTMPLEKVNVYAENIKNLIETVIDDKGM